MRLTRWKRGDGFYSDERPSGGMWVHVILGLLSFAAGCGVGVWGYASWLARDRPGQPIDAGPLDYRVLAVWAIIGGVTGVLSYARFVSGGSRGGQDNYDDN